MRTPKRLFMAIVPVSVWLSSRRWLNHVTRPVMRGLASATIRMRNARPQSTIEGIGDEWQRMFPSRKGVPITRVENETVYAEIRMPCPHRGTGNVDGCYRMMEYDRKMMEKIGSKFIVVKSQAEAGVSHCQIAISKSTTDLPIEAKDRIARGVHH